MKELMKWKRTGLSMALLCLLTYGLMLAGCGGGGGAAANGVSSQVISGVAATGAPLAGQVGIKNASGMERSTVIGSDGSFALDVTGMTGPYLLQGTGNVNGVINTLYSFAGAPGTANINPLSNAAVAKAAGVDDPAQVYTYPDPAVLQKIQANLPDAMAGIMADLQPQLVQYGADRVDPIKGMYVANHIGLDAMFDNLRVNTAHGVVTAVAINAPQTRAVMLAAAPDGAALYATYCASCHRALASSQERNASASKITSAINGGVSQMGTSTLRALTSTQITAIAAALSGTATTSSPTTAPAAPAGVSATGGAAQMTISWNAVSNATSYYIYWSLTSGVTRSNGTRITGAGSPYVLTGLTSGTTYYFIVTALNSAGQSSASPQVSATTTTGTGTTPPPTTLDGAALYGTYCSSCHGALASSSKGGRTSAQITSAISGNSGGMGSLSSLTAAQISAIATALAGTTTTSPSSTDGAALYASYCASCHNALASSQERNASASKITSAINGGVSQMSTTTLRALTSTQITAIAAALSGTATLAIPAAPSGVIATGGTKQATISWPVVTGATSYNIYWSTTAGVTKTSGTKLTGVTSPTVRTGLTDLTTYYYIVTAVNSAGESAASVQVAATTLSSIPATSVPSAPASVSATGGAQQATISWSAVTGAASYNIYWSTTAGVTTTTGTRLAGVTSPYIQSGLAVTTYYYIVTAVNSLGESAPSAQVTATTTVITIDGAALYGTYCASCHNALPSSAKKGRTATQISSAISANSGGMGSLSSLTAAQISAIAAALSGTTTTPPPTTVPAAPAGVTATGGTQQATITWSAVTGATSYNIYRSTTTGVTITSGTKSSVVASSAVQTGLADSTTYYYIVTAVNSVGESAPSVQVAATTTPPSITPPPTPDGVALYGTYCAGCHGALASSAKQGRTAAQITAAIGVISNGMSSLSSLTPAQVSAIATALAVITPPPPPPPPPVGGTVSYSIYIQPILNANCVSCHGPGNLTYISLDSYAGTVATVIPGDAVNSSLYKSIVGGLGVIQMPIQPIPQLIAAQIQLFTDWINQGALNN